MNKIKVTLTTSKEYKIPTLPNFIRDDSGRATPIEDFTPKQIKEIGEQWTDALIRKANIKRGEKIRQINKNLGNLDD